MRSLLLGGLKGIQSRLEPDELVYLALTSKPERQVVDRLAWEVQRTGAAIAAREWKRTDLAVFRRGDANPAALLEAKAFSSFAAVHQPKKYPALISADIDKGVALARTFPDPAEVFVLAVMTHPKKKVPEKFKDFVKYRFWLREPVDFEEASDRVAGALGPRGALETLKLQEGSAWSIPTRVDAWLCGPILPARLEMKPPETAI